MYNHLPGSFSFESELFGYFGIISVPAKLQAL